MTETSTLSIGILTIDHPARHAFDDRLRRTGQGYDRLRIDDVLRRAGYRPVRFEYLPDLLAACDRHPFDLLVVQCETPCYRTAEAVRTLRARFAMSMPLLIISQHDDHDGARTIALDAGANEYLPYASPPETIVSSVSTWLRWAHYRTTHHRHWRIGSFEFDAANRTVRVDGRDHVLTEKHFQIATALFMNLGRPLSRPHLSQLVWGSLVAVSSRRLDTHITNLRGRLRLDGRYGLRLTTVYGFGYRLVECEPGVEAGPEPAPEHAHTCRPGP
ncbi:Response regulator [Burkholderia diffusa]|uniref:response regulator transcription factor n=1 Tax=Burkholderia diffusa TaxID=488732 RepID=UPI001CB26B9E|nr:response regulator transcription factor [Burkholderia diffusa]CAG9264189.1 Response regulator [Burkholderia diffusa]